MQYGFVYIWYDAKRKMFYIGSHWGTEDDGYVCSSKRMREAHRRRPQDFSRRIIGYNYVSRYELFEQEQWWLDKIHLGPKYYNLQKVVKNHWSCKEGLTTRQKMSLNHRSNKGYAPPRLGTKGKIKLRSTSKNRLKGNNRTFKQLIANVFKSERQIGIKFSIERRQKMSEGHKK